MTDTTTRPLESASHGWRTAGVRLGTKTAARTSCGCLVPSLDELLAAVVRAQRLKLITIKEVCERGGVSASFVHAEIAAGRFPKPVKLGASRSRRAASRFVDSEISDWIQKHIDERDFAGDGTREVAMP